MQAACWDTRGSGIRIDWNGEQLGLDADARSFLALNLARPEEVGRSWRKCMGELKEVWRGTGSKHVSASQQIRLL